MDRDCIDPGTSDIGVVGGVVTVATHCEEKICASSGGFSRQRVAGGEEMGKGSCFGVGVPDLVDFGFVVCFGQIDWSEGCQQHCIEGAPFEWHFP
ncbi:hypothetical protein QJS10_CPB18g01487 [Acorus calamus]|uniref:Uncharacterized protein n=1 Tax=Acorus calamus TaxID=4465 RepID=A0AAV9CNU8_ACOCL|nr:hypothetical protein QJS10_CPB18g01487 [Acorus calamus]